MLADTEANEGQVDPLDGRFWRGAIFVLRVSARPA
jgi:hypothetical protein